MELRLYQEFPIELESQWNMLLKESSTNVPFLRFDYLHTWWQTRGGGEWPGEAQIVIVTACEGERLVGIAPLFYTPDWEGKPALLLLGSIEISDYLDLIARPEDLPRFTEALLAYLQAENGKSLPEWSRLDFYNVLENSPSLDALQIIAQRLGWSYGCVPFRPSLSIQLPGDWETYLAGIDKKQRHEIRRKMRRAANAGVPVRWYIAQDPEKIEEEIDAFLSLMANDPEKDRFLTPPMRENFRNTMRAAFDQGYLSLAFLEIDSKKAAAYLNFDYLNTLWVYNSGMDNRFVEFSPGWVLLGELLKWANETGRTCFDFMRGDEDYKIRFGAKQRNVVRVTLSPQ